MEELASRLYRRRHEAVHVRRANVRVGEWAPQPRECHDNVAVWCKHHPNHRPIKGWLVASYDLGLFSFMTHAVIEDEAGNLIDITPTLIPCPYPFLRHDDADGEFNENLMTLPFLAR